MRVTPIKTRVFKEGEDVADLVASRVKKLENGAVLVVASKIVALSEGRTLATQDEKEIDAVIRKESQLAIKTKYVWLTIKDGMVQASAGVDKSNGDGKIVLAPKDSFKAAKDLREKLRKHYGIKDLGVIISDSGLVPLRAGVMGAALGYAGFKGVRDYRGTPDLFGRIMRFSQTNIADGLATAATLLMGEGNEQKPLAIITDAPVEFADKTRKGEVSIDPADDIYYPLFKNLL